MRGLPARARRPADPLARARRHGEDVRPARARLGVARLVRAALHRRPRLVLRRARRLPDRRPAPAGLRGDGDAPRRMARMMVMSGGGGVHAARRRAAARRRRKASGSKAWRVLLLEDTGELLSRRRARPNGARAVALSERRRRADRPGAARPRARDDERGDPHPASRRSRGPAARRRTSSSRALPPEEANRWLDRRRARRARATGRRRSPRCSLGWRAPMASSRHREAELRVLIG